MAQVSDMKIMASEHIEHRGEDRHPSLHVPVAFKIWCDKARLTHPVFYIGRERSECLNAIHVGYSKLIRARVKLHAGPDIDSAFLAEATLRGSTIDLEFLNGNQIKMTRTGCSSTSDWDFALQDKTNHGLAVFQWHRSKGDNIKQLGVRGSGWELIWKRGGQPDEIVAAYAVDLCSIKLSIHFAFVGIGATDHFDQTFPSAAIIIAIALGQKRRDNVTATMGVLA